MSEVENLSTEAAVEGEQEPVVENTESSETGESQETQASEGATKIASDEAARIREATEHKMTRKFQKEREKYDAELEGYKKKVSDLSTPPDDESVYDEVIGWRPKNMSADEFRQRLVEQQQQNAAQKVQQDFTAPVERRALEIAAKTPDFESVLKNAASQGIVSETMVLLAGQEDGGLETIYDLAKTNSQKLLEISQMPEHRQAKEIWKAVWNRKAPVAPKTTNADTPVLSERDGETGNTNYADMSYSDGYKEYEKQRLRD
jgi:hypothetical protein